MLNWLIIFGVFWVAWKMVPKHLSSLTGDVLRLEWIRELQARSTERKQKDLTPEQVGATFARRIFAVSVVIGALITILSSSLPIFISMMFGTITAVGTALIIFRLTRHRRLVVLPLYLTLCRIPGSRWDATQNPTKYLRVPKKSGQPLKLRLPMDWHAGPMQLREIQSIVQSRVPGTWKMEVDAPRFLLTFRPVITSVVDVGPESKSTLGISATLLSKDQDTDEMADEIEIGGPW